MFAMLNGNTTLWINFVRIENAESIANNYLMRGHLNFSERLDFVTQKLFCFIQHAEISLTIYGLKSEDPRLKFIRKVVILMECFRGLTHKKATHHTLNPMNLDLKTSIEVMALTFRIIAASKILKQISFSLNIRIELVASIIQIIADIYLLKETIERRT